MRRRPYLVVGWLWYLGMLVPVIGLVQVGLQAMADRYTYLPFVGVFIMIAWGVSDIVDEWRYGRRAGHRKPVIRRREDAMAGQAPALSPRRGRIVGRPIANRGCR